ncbi:MAG TPA: GH3 auxin-responsive promoter family protein [Alphaproteobacteria bacterium]|nr:GH3 auxin-responsive promoter family protein [Alphaproteobacteria bacterium]
MLDATPLLHLYAARRRRQLAREHAAEAQQAQLLSLLRRAQATSFGKRHGFARLRSVHDYQAAVPLRRYEDFWREFWQPVFPRLGGQTWPSHIPYLAVTSGTTTGKTKYIPVSREMVAANRRAVLDMFTHHLTNRPRSRVLGGRNFMLGGSLALERQAPGIWSGDLSGIAAKEVPLWARPRYFPPRKEALIADWDAKIARLARLSLAADIRTISGTPSWLLIFFDKLAELRGGASRRLAGYYPHLELLAHGGVDFSPYRRTFETLLEGSHAELREVYPASEGFIAVADRGPGEGLRLILDNGLFYEFVPAEELVSANPKRHWIATAEPGVNYAVILTSCAGLWAYVLGDTVMLVDRAPPRLLVTGRTSYALSAFGEHLINAEIEAAVATAAETVGLSVIDYTVAPLYPSQAGERGGHLFVVEFAEETPTAPVLAAFAEALDRDLAVRNADYAVHRAGGVGMREPRIRAVPPGGFAAWMRSRGRVGGQNKIPRVITDAALLAALLEFLDRRSGG